MINEQIQELVNQKNKTGSFTKNIGVDRREFLFLFESYKINIEKFVKIFNKSFSSCCKIIQEKEIKGIMENTKDGIIKPVYLKCLKSIIGEDEYKQLREYYFIHKERKFSSIFN